MAVKMKFHPPTHTGGAVGGCSAGFRIYMPQSILLYSASASVLPLFWYLRQVMPAE